MPTFSSLLRVLPFLMWVVFILGVGSEFRDQQWECLLVVFAALELIPRGLRLFGIPIHPLFWLAVLGLCAAYLWSSVWFLSLPYVVWAVWLTVREGTELMVQKNRQLLDYVRVAGLAYWATGAVFAGMYLTGIRPLGFDPVIVSLTAAHFHVAGFALAVVVFAQKRLLDNVLSRVLAVAVLAGMPLVAAGITATQMGYNHLIEQVSALVFVLFALGVLWQQVRLVLRRESDTYARVYWLLGSFCLFFGLFLAAFYALRFQYPAEWVSIPNMKIWHGTLNTLGFAWVSLLGYSKVYSV